MYIVAEDCCSNSWNADDEIDAMNSSRIHVIPIHLTFKHRNEQAYFDEHFKGKDFFSEQADGLKICKQERGKRNFEFYVGNTHMSSHKEFWKKIFL